MAAHRLGQDEAYFTVREILAEASTAVPPKAGLWREPSDFCRCGFATLGFTKALRYVSNFDLNDFPQFSNLTPSTVSTISTISTI